MANTITVSVPGSASLASPLASGFFAPANVAYTASSSGTVDLINGDYYFDTSPSGQIQSSNAGAYIFDNGFGFAYDSDGGPASVASQPFGALIAEFISTGADSPVFVNIGAGTSFVAPNFDSFVSLFVNDTGSADNTGSFSTTLDYVPEPISISILGVGLAGLLASRRRA